MLSFVAWCHRYNKIDNNNVNKAHRYAAV